MNRKNIVYTAFCVLLAGLFFGCDNYQGDQEAPSYIRIKGFRLVANPEASFTQTQDEAFLSSEISAVRVYVTTDKEEKVVGTYSFRKDSSDIVIPVLEKGRRAIELRPVIKYNGMTSTRDWYQFYTTWKDTVELTEGKIADIDVKNVMYSSSARISAAYMFEDAFNPFENAPNIDSLQTNLMHVITGDSVAYGVKCGAFYSQKAQDNYQVLTIDTFSCTNHNAMILELDYHSNIDFDLGLYGQTSATSASYYIPCMQIRANDKPMYLPSDRRNWQKMYIILGKVWGQMSYNPFRIWFRPRNTEGNAKGFVHIDNIKIVHFPE